MPTPNSTPAPLDSFTSANLNLLPVTASQQTIALTPQAVVAPPPPPTRHRARTVVCASPPVVLRRHNTRLAAKDKGKYVDMTNKAVKKKALENALSACSPAVQQHVKRRGLLSRNKLPIAIPGLCCWPGMFDSGARGRCVAHTYVMQVSNLLGSSDVQCSSMFWTCLVRSLFSLFSLVRKPLGSPSTLSFLLRSWSEGFLPTGDSLQIAVVMVSDSSTHVCSRGVLVYPSS